MSSFRLNGSRLFLTYPRCDAPREGVIEFFQSKFRGQIKHLCVAKESHAPSESDPVGGPHYHVYLHLTKRVNYVNPRSLDMWNFHGDYKVAKGSFQQVLAYLTKEDHEPYCEGFDLEESLHPKKKAKLSDEVAVKLKEGVSLRDLESEFPGYYMMNMKKIKEYQAELRSFEEAKKEVTPHYLTIDDDTFEIGTKREHRQKQLYIWGPAGVGKTTIVNRLIDSGLRAFHLPYNGHWEEWSDGSFDFAYADEYHSQVRITEMNKFLEGSMMHLPCRFQNKIKLRNVLTIVISNVPPESQYPNQPQAIKDAFLDRLTVIHLTSFPSVTVIPMTVLSSTPIPSPPPE